MASSSSFASDSQYCPRWKYDVFLSFRGEDTRKNFTGHLYVGLKNRGIFTFQDDKRLEEGDSISAEPLKAIEESQVAIVIFSKNYATSSWCLNELMKIMECKEKNGQIVIPVFYDVDPSEVRKQTKSFAEAFAEHESKYKDNVEGMQKVQRWRTALTTAADLKGYDIRNEDESEKIQEIVDYISKICKSAPFLQDIVGINAHLEKLKSRLQIEINDVRVLGIWGIGGVGKTTIAKALFDTLSDQFKAACFLADVKENARNNQLHSLQNTLLSKLLRKKDDYVNNKHEGKSMIRSRLCSMKVLIVLDDIDHTDHLEYLAGDVGWFGNGSRVIVTTRNRHFIEKDDAIYEVPTLTDPEAMQVFNQHAFKNKVPDEHFKELSLEVVDQAKGLPLALKVWGSLLHKTDLIQWRITVDQIKKNSNLDIVEKLKISYDGLEPKEQKIFLDIACFFRGFKRTEVMQILKSCGFEAERGLYVLIDKSLAFISEYDRIEMHDLIEDMGKYIVKMQKEDLGKPSRIWNVEDFEDVMVDNTGTMAVEAVWFSYSSEKLCFSIEAMTNMQNLRILCIKNMHYGYLNEDVALGMYRTFNENYDSVEYLSNNLRWFVWHGYPRKLLPQNFNPRKLVHLDLSRSALHYLWNETKQLLSLLSLQSLDLSYCNKLKEFPDFTRMPNLETLNLRNCNVTDGGLPENIGYLSSLKNLDLSGNNFEHLPRSIAQLGALQSLDLSYCNELKEFPGFTGMPNLETLNLRNCNLTDGGLTEDIGSLSSLKELYLSGNNFEHLPRSIAQLGALQSLDLSNCNKLKEFPGFTRMPNLETLNLRNCNLTDGGLPEDIGSLSSLKELYLSRNNFEHLPRSIAQLGALQSLYLSNCNKLKEFPGFTGMPNLETLNLRDSNLIDGLPEDIGSLSSLKELYLSRNNFEHLPRSIAQLGALQSLDLSNCNKLKEFPGFTGMTNLENLNLNYCNLTDGGLPEDIGSLSSLKELYLSGNNFEHLPRSIAQLSALQSLDLSNCNKLKEFPGFTGMPNLETLNLRNGNLTDGGLLEDIGSLSSLKELYLSGNNFEHLPRSIAQLGALQSLDLSNCNKLKEFPGFTGMGNLETLNLSYCNLTDGGLPEDIGSLSSLKELYLSVNNFEHLPRSIAQLGALQSLDLSNCNKLKEFPGFTGMPNLETLNLSYCNLTDGGLPEDIGSLSSLKELYLSRNNFEHLPRSIAQLGALQSLDLSNCNKLKEFPGFTGMPNLETLNLSYCNLTDGGLPEDIGSLSSLKELYLSGNNFEHLPRSIAQLGAVRSLDLSGCNKLKELPEFAQQLNTIKADWSNDSICNSLFQNISSVQHDISVSDSLSLRVFTSCPKNIPSWFHHQGTGTSVSVNLRNNWYVSDKFLGFAVCYSGKLIDITAHLCDDEMNQKFALSNHSIWSNYEYGMHFFLVPLAGLWDASKANGKTPNDYEIISLFFGEVKEFGVRLLYKDEPELHIPIRRSRYEEACCCFPLLQLFPRRPGL